MELTCSRCHQTVLDEYCYCPACGLPQLVYSADNSADAGQRDRWSEAVRDASTVDWHSALRSTLPIAIPAGILCSMLSPVGIFGLILMGGTAAWAVVLYSRKQRPAWITIGAGARIGLVTGIVASWTAAAATGLSLYALRFWLHQGNLFDDFWQGFINQQMAQGNAVGGDPQTLASIKALMVSSQGRAGMVLFAIAFLMATLLLFAIAGGALGARVLTRTRRPES
jgi:hypothetical protein